VGLLSSVRWVDPSTGLARERIVEMDRYAPFSPEPLHPFVVHAEGPSFEQVVGHLAAQRDLISCRLPG